MRRPARNTYLSLEFKRFEWQALMDYLLSAEETYPDEKDLIRKFLKEIQRNGIQTRYEDQLDSEDERWRSNR